MAIAVVYALAAVGCTDDAAMVTEADADRTVMLRVQQDLVVTLGSNPSTGYRWEFQMIRRDTCPSIPPRTNRSGRRSRDPGASRRSASRR
jgi:hypothetical protein